MLSRAGAQNCKVWTVSIHGTRPPCHHWMRRFQSIQAARALSIADLAPSLHRLKAFENRYVLPSSTLVSDAAKHLLENRLTFALVHDDQVSNSAALAASRGGSVVGMITERNLLRYATHAGDLAFFSGREHGEPTLERWMTPREEMMSVKLDDPLEHAASLLHSGVWRHLPVLDYWGKLHSVAAGNSLRIGAFERVLAVAPLLVAAQCLVDLLG